MTTKTIATELRRCIGSKTFGIGAHEAPADEFPVQPSQKDGLGRMCKPHWRQYTNALRKAAVARRAAEVEVPGPQAESEEPTAEAEGTKPRRSRRSTAQPEPEADVTVPDIG